MKKQIYDEKNGMSYTLHGDYYLPDLVLNEAEPTYGKYGMLRKQFLKEHRSARYQYLLRKKTLLRSTPRTAGKQRLKISLPPCPTWTRICASLPPQR